MNALFQPAVPTNAFLKMGLTGFGGSGKTFTSTETAIGLVSLCRDLQLPYAKRPVFFIDTEKGSDWVIPRFKAANIPFHTAKTRAFKDLLTAVDEAEENASLLLVDSATHFWREFCETYVARRARETRNPNYSLRFGDWAFLKKEWGRFTDRFVNSKLHIILAGRAGYEYDMRAPDDEEGGKKELVKTGIKMKAESEMSYEPDLYVLMERVMNMASKKDEHVAHVLKDRSTMLDGHEAIDPKFDFFLPHVKALNLGGTHIGVDVSRTSDELIPANSPRDRRAMQRQIVIDELNDLLLNHDAGGTSEAAKKKRSELLRVHFKTASKTRIEEAMSLDDLRDGYDSLHRELLGKPSRYTITPDQIGSVLPVEGYTPLPEEPDAGTDVEDHYARAGM